MGKTPAQENRAKAKKGGMSHEQVKKDQAAEARRIKELANKDAAFGMTKGAAMNRKHEVHMQRLRDMNDPTTELEATLRAAGKGEGAARVFAQNGDQREQPELVTGWIRRRCCVNSSSMGAAQDGG